MAKDREEFFDQVLNGYAENYDIVPAGPTEDGLPLAARADLQMEQLGYILSKKAKMWSANSEEFVYFFNAPALTDDLCAKVLAYVWKDGISRIDLTNKKDHMCTRITMVCLCDKADEAAMERVSKCRLYKSFQFSLKGWAECHAVAVELGKSSVVSNRYGRETAEFMKSVLNPQPMRKKNKKFWGIF